MSESEKKRRLEYRKRRRRRIWLQAVIVAIAAIIALGSVALYFYADKTIYVSYSEKSDVDYRVHLLDNGDRFDTDVLDKGQTYIAELIDQIPLSFLYELNMDSDGVDYQYSYSIDAELLIADNKTQTPILSRVEPLMEEQTLTKEDSNSFKIAESVLIDYQPYHTFARDFIATYDLSGVSATLIVRMNVSVVGSCDDFESNTRNRYTVAANIPVAQTTLNVDVSSTVPTGESRVIACNNGWVRDAAKTAAIISGCLAAILLAILLAYAYLTRNHDINYSIRIKRLYAAYKAYIQRTTEPFATEGCQVVEVDSFESMLNIRDTIQSPILMSENEDRTCTTFVIPSPTDIIYLFRIKVEDYDELYATAAQEPVCESAPVTVAESGPVEVTITERTAEAAPKVTVIKVKKQKAQKSNTLSALLLGAAVFTGSALASFHAHDKKHK